MFVLLFIIASASLAVPVTNAASNCSVCQLGNYFSESNGYGCFDSMNGTVVCTCPDRLYTFDQPCRICDRFNICGNDPNAFCAETSLDVLGVQTNETHGFACFCSDMTFRVGEPCPSAIISTTIITTTTPPAKN